MTGGVALPGTLRLTPAVAAALLDHARAELPNEACGLLAGSLRTGQATTYHPARNADASPRRFDLHPDDLVRIVLAIDDAGQDLVAIFHSHTRSPAVPSASDLREARYPAAWYLVASLTDPAALPKAALRAWRIRDGIGEELPLVVG